MLCNYLSKILGVGWGIQAMDILDSRSFHKNSIGCEVYHRSLHLGSKSITTQTHSYATNIKWL